MKTKTNCQLSQLTALVTVLAATLASQACAYHGKKKAADPAANSAPQTVVAAPNPASAKAAEPKMIGEWELSADDEKAKQNHVSLSVQDGGDKATTIVIVRSKLDVAKNEKICVQTNTLTVKTMASNVIHATGVTACSDDCKTKSGKDGNIACVASDVAAETYLGYDVNLGNTLEIQPQDKDGNPLEKDAKGVGFIYHFNRVDSAAAARK